MSKPMSPINRFIGLLKSERESVKKVYLYAILNGLVALSLPLGIQAIISFIQTGQISASWFVLVFLVVGGIVLAGWLQILQLKVSEEIQQRIYAKSALELGYRIPQIESEEIYHHYAPELANRFFDTLTIQKGLSKILIDFTSAVMQIFFGLILLAFYHPFFIFLGLLISFSLFAIIRVTFNQGLSTSIKESKYKYKTAHWLEEIARSASVFKLSGNSSFHLEKTDDITSSYLGARKKHFSILLKQYWSMVGFKAILALSLLLIGGFLVINQNMNIGQFVAAEIIILLVLSSVEKLILSTEMLYDVLTAFDKLGTITDLTLEHNALNISHFQEKKQGIQVSLSQLSFTYPNHGKPVLKNIDLEVKAGTSACLIGLNASGKASLLNVISTLYKPSAGVIRYNDVNLNNLDVNKLRSEMGTLIESAGLFESTLLENISLNRPAITIDDVNWAVENVQLTGFLSQQTEGLNTLLEPTGKALSKSIKQKILLARSIVARPKLLIIGDAVNNISAADSVKIIDFLTDKANNWTLLISTSNKYLASKCDKVVLLQQGEVLMEGTYKELIFNNTVKNILYA